MEDISFKAFADVGKNPVGTKKTDPEPPVAKATPVPRAKAPRKEKVAPAQKAEEKQEPEDENSVSKKEEPPQNWGDLLTDEQTNMIRETIMGTSWSDTTLLADFRGSILQIDKAEHFLNARIADLIAAQDILIGKISKSKFKDLAKRYLLSDESKTEGKSVRDLLQYVRDNADAPPVRQAAPKQESVKNSAFDIQRPVTRGMDLNLEKFIKSQPGNIMCGLLDIFAYSALAPSQVIFKLKKKAEKDGDAGWKGRIVSDEEIMEAAINGAYYNSRLLDGRTMNSAAVYKGFLMTMHGQGVNLNWGWADLMEVVHSVHADSMAQVVRAGIARLDAGVLGMGCYGPLIWRVAPQQLLDAHNQLISSMKKENFKNKTLPKECPPLSRVMNIPLCGIVCMKYMTNQQIVGRIQIGVPWAINAKDKPIQLRDGNLTSDQGAEIIKKSVYEYQQFIIAQNRANRAPKKRTPVRQGKKSAEGYKVTINSDW